MIITEVRPPAVNRKFWSLIGPSGESLSLPCADSGPFRIGLIGTRSNLVKANKTSKFAETLDKLNCPIYLIDIRRNGMGGNGSWGPLEFASLIPQMMSKSHSYSFFHIPILAPEKRLLEQYRKASKLSSSLDSQGIDEIKQRLEQQGMAYNKNIPEFAWQHWQVFQSQYTQGMTKTAIEVGRAFVEASRTIQGIAIFVCAEEHLPDFDGADQKLQDDRYCHRYTLASLIVKSLRESFPSEEIELVCLRLGGDPEIHRWTEGRWH